MKEVQSQPMTKQTEESYGQNQERERKETRLFQIDPKHLENFEVELDQAAALIAEGKLVAIPTETVYGLAADASNGEAVASIFKAKGRPQDNPLIVHISRMQDLQKVASRVPKEALRLAEVFWPGPLTIILPKTSLISDVTSAGLDTVAIRFPSHPTAQELIRRSGVPVAAPSANLSGSPSTTSAKHCIDDLWGRVDGIVDSGECEVGLESTVISLVSETPRLLRPGYVTLEQLEAVLGQVEVDQAVTQKPPEDAKVASPGMKYKHYAPKCQVILLEGSRKQFSEYVNQHAVVGTVALCYEEDLPNLRIPAFSIGKEADQAAQAAHLFRCLRDLDQQGVSLVYARCPSRKGVGLALYNRLIRAAAFQVIKL